MSTIETIGWIGSIAFAICAVPQAYQSWKGGNSNGVSWGFLNLWLLGEIATLIYVVPKQHWPLIFNYLGNILFISIIVYYKLKPRRIE